MKASDASFLLDGCTSFILPTEGSIRQIDTSELACLIPALNETKDHFALV